MSRLSSWLIAVLFGAVVVGGIFYFVPQAEAQVMSTAVRMTVFRAPSESDPPTTYWGVDYPPTYTFTQPSGGFLKIYNGTVVVAVWATGQWARVEYIYPAAAGGNTP